MASRNSFLDSPNFRDIVPDSQRSKVERRRSRSGTTGRGSRRDPIREATQQEQRQDQLRQLQRDLDEQGGRITADEAQAIIEGRQSVDSIRNQIVTRQRRQGLQQLQRQLSTTDTRLTEQEAQSILSGEADIGAISQRAVQRAQAQRRERIQQELSGLNLSDPRVATLIDQGLTPRQVSDLQAREAFVGRQLRQTRDAALQQGVIEDLQPRDDLFFGERLAGASERRIGALRASGQEGFIPASQEFLFGAGVGAGNIAGFTEGVGRAAPFFNPFTAPVAFLNRRLSGVDPRTERALQAGLDVTGSVGQAGASTLLPFAPLTRDLLVGRSPGIPGSGLTNIRGSSLASAAVGTRNIITGVDDLLFGIAEPGAQAVQQIEGGLTERELGILGVEGLASIPALQPVETLRRAQAGARRVGQRVDDFVGTLPRENRVVSVRGEGVIGDIPPGLTRQQQALYDARIDRLRPTSTVFDDLLPPSIQQLDNVDNRLLLSVQEQAEIEGLFGGTGRADLLARQRLQQFPPEPAQIAFANQRAIIPPESQIFFTDEFLNRPILFRQDFTIPSRRRARDIIGLQEQQQADLLAQRIGDRVEAERQLLQRAGQDRRLQRAINPSQEIIDQLLFVEQRPSVASRSLLDFYEDLRPPLRNRLQRQNPDTISISQLLPEREIIRITDDGRLVRGVVGGDIGRGVPGFSVSSRGGRQAQDILREAFDEASIIAPPVRSELFFDPTGVSSLLRRSRVTRTPRSSVSSSPESSLSRAFRPRSINDLLPDTSLRVGASPFAFLGSDSAFDSLTSFDSQQETLPDIDLGLSNDLFVTSVLESDDLLASSQRSVLETEQDLGVGQAQRTGIQQEIDSVLATGNVTQQLSDQDLISPRPTRTTTRQPPRKPPRRRRGGLPEVEREALEGSEGALFEVKVGSRGQQNYADLGQGGVELVRQAENIVDNTPAASLQAVPLNERARRTNIKRLLGTDYRKSKAKNKNNTYVEKNKARIDSVGELVGITQKGQRARSTQTVTNNPRLNRQARELVNLGVPLRTARNNLGGGVLDDFF